MTERKKQDEVAPKSVTDIGDLERRLDMLDRRLDNIDSVVNAVVERIMSQPVALNITCPSCGRNIEITIIGSQKPKR